VRARKIHVLRKLRISAFSRVFSKALYVDTTKGLVKQHFRYPNHGATLIIKLVLIEMKQQRN
jgi:hypothetical protein